MEQTFYHKYKLLLLNKLSNEIHSEPSLIINLKMSLSIFNSLLLLTDRLKIPHGRFEQVNSHHCNS